MWLLLILLVILSLLLTHVYIKKTSRIGKMLADMPTLPGALPFIGYAHQFGTTPEDVFRNSVNIFNKVEPIGVLWLGPEAFIIISSPEYFEAVTTNKNFNNKAFLYDFFAEYLGLVVASGDLWYKKRKMLTPAFHFQILHDVVDNFNSNAITLVNTLRKFVGKSGFDIFHYVELCVFDVVAESLMGVPINAQSKSHIPFITAVVEGAQVVQTRMYKPWLYIDWIYRLSQHSKIFEKSRMIGENFVLDVIKKKKEQRIQDKLLKETKKNDTEQVPGQKKYMAFLDTLLENIENGFEFSDQELTREVAAFMIVAHHTLTVAVSFTIYALMKNPAVQEKVIEELDDLFGKLDRMPTLNDLHELKYLDKVVKETLRMYPSIPFVLRSVLEDTQLPGGYTAPEGSTILLSIYNLHHNPKVYPDPHIFDPERFDPENSSKRHPFAFCPFSAGARNCIGQRFALIQIKVMVSTILRNFRILPPIDKPDIHLGIGIALISSTGINVRLVER